jgi:hypothetical protein
MLDGSIRDKTKKMAGLEGLEPPTFGFGGRCTSHCATGLHEKPMGACLFDFAMYGMFALKPAVFFQFEALGLLTLVARGRVVALLTFRTL